MCISQRILDPKTPKILLSYSAQQTLLFGLSLVYSVTGICKSVSVNTSGEMESRFAIKYTLPVSKWSFLRFEGNYAERLAKFFVLHFSSLILVIANKTSSMSFSLTSVVSLFRGNFHLTNAIRLNEYCILRTDMHFNTSCPYRGHRGSSVVKVLCYKSEGCWFDPSWCHCNFSLT